MNASCGEPQRVVTAAKGPTQGVLQSAVRVSPPDNPKILKELAWINSAIICLLFWSCDLCYLKHAVGDRNFSVPFYLSVWKIKR